MTSNLTPAPSMPAPARVTPAECEVNHTMDTRGNYASWCTCTLEAAPTVGYRLVLSDIERACGVTPEAVLALVPRTLIRRGNVMLPQGTPPALAGAAARAALGTPDVEFSHLWAGNPVYRAL